MNDDVKELFIVGIDIAGYSLKPLHAQQGAQLTIDRALSEAHRQNTKRNRPRPAWLDGGDGGYALFEWTSGRDVLEMVKDFCEIIANDNKRLSSDHAVSVRVALHHGQVICWKGDKNSSRYTSHAINECARFLAGMSRDPGRVVCSQEFLNKIMAIREIVKSTRLHDVVDKHGQVHRIYNLHQEPGLGLPPRKNELHPNPFVG